MEREGKQLPAVKKDDAPSVVRRVARAMLDLAVQHGFPLARTTSELIAEHKGRLDSMEALKTVYIEEGRAAAQVKGDLLKRAAETTDPLQRQQILDAVSRVDCQIRTVSIGIQALPHIAAAQAKTAENVEVDKERPADQWLDTFLQFARMRNESWRQDLLARLLAIEMTAPGTMGPEVIWAVGQLSEDTFHCYAHFLDIVVWEGDSASYIFPYGGDEFPIMNERIVNSSLKHGLKYGNLIPQIQHANLVHPVVPLGMGVGRQYRKGETTPFRYGSKTLCGKWNEDYRSTGILPTALGEAVARLYEPKPHALGGDLFHKWTKTLGSFGWVIDHSP